MRTHANSLRALAQSERHVSSAPIRAPERSSRQNMHASSNIAHNVETFPIHNDHRHYNTFESKTNYFKSLVEGMNSSVGHLKDSEYSHFLLVFLLVRIRAEADVLAL